MSARALYLKLLSMYKHGVPVFTFYGGILRDASGEFLADLSADVTEGVEYSADDILRFIAALRTGHWLKGVATV